MWLLLSAKLRRYLLASVALPLAGRAAGAVGDRLEKRAGEPTRASRTLRKGSELASRKRRKQAQAARDEERRAGA